jgi:hypothetical protein
MRSLFVYHSKSERETRKRIKLSVAAFAYEFENDNVRSIMSDGDFDALAKTIDLTIDTARPDLDHFFRTEFHPCTGQWIRSHPELKRIEEIYYAHYHA